MITYRNCSANPLVAENYFYIDHDNRIWHNERRSDASAIGLAKVSGDWIAFFLVGR